MQKKNFNWEKIVKYILTSRFIDEIEELELVPQKKITYQFSAKGHELVQVLLSSLLNQKHDFASIYYRSRPFALVQGLTIEESFLSSMGKNCAINNGRDIGVVFNLPQKKMGTIIPSSGDVGSQFTTAVGTAQAILYHKNILKNDEWKNSIAVVCGGDASVATNGFWSALNIATTLKLPILFSIEDNGFGISTSNKLQTPDGNISKNLKSFKNLYILTCDGTEPKDASEKISSAIKYVRNGFGPCLLHSKVVRISGHSFSDLQHYKSEKQKQFENKNDPILKLKKFVVPKILSLSEWNKLKKETFNLVNKIKDIALLKEEPKIESVSKFLFSKNKFVEPKEESFSNVRVTMIESIRKTLEIELEKNKNILVFGEDVGMKGGVHGATVGLQKKFGKKRIFDTSLSEEGIVGRAVGMSFTGLKPITEIQFRKYTDTATEQINNCGTVRWRTNNNFSAPIIIRIPVGVGKKTGDMWHSVSGESIFSHTLGWQIAFPSNAEDACGLLRSAIQNENPTFFLEHRTLYDSINARSLFPNKSFTIEFGKAKIVRSGNEATIISWGEMLHRSIDAVKNINADVDIIDLRTIIPLDKETIFSSIKKTGKCLIVHEDQITSGFGAEISATILENCFQFLDAPIVRVATTDIPIPYNVELMESVIPSVEKIKIELEKLLKY